MNSKNGGDLGVYKIERFKYVDTLNILCLSK